MRAATDEIVVNTRNTMSRLSATLALLTILIALPGSASGTDATREKLDKAKADYETEVEKARNIVLDRYEEVLVSLADTGKLDDALKLRNELTAFESDGIMTGRTELRKAFIDYGHSLAKAKVNLSKAYQEALVTYTKLLEFEKANELRTEFIDRSLSTRLVSIQLTNVRTHYIQHGNYLGWLGKADGDAERLNSTFELIPGLAEKDTISFRSANVPNHYLAHGDFRLHLTKNDDSDGFWSNATFKHVSGLASSNALSFEAVNFRGHYIRAKGQELWVEKNDGSAQFKLDATFSIADPKFKLW